MVSHILGLECPTDAWIRQNLRIPFVQILIRRRRLKALFLLLAYVCDLSLCFTMRGPSTLMFVSPSCCVSFWSPQSVGGRRRGKTEVVLFDASLSA